MPGVVGAEAPAGKFMLGLEVGGRLLSLADRVVLGLGGGVGAALGVEAVGAADQEVGGVGLGQHAYVVLALVLGE